MANQEHLDILKQGVEVWDRWRLTQRKVRGYPLDLLWENKRIEPDFKADLTGANLVKADLRGADLRGVDFRNACLSEADLGLANLSFSNLGQADLTGANLKRADLTRADLSEADLRGADLRGANLTRAILVKTNLRRATLANCLVYGIAVWDVDVTETDQSNLIISQDHIFRQERKPLVAVDNLEVAQFVHLLLNHKKLRNVLNAVTERGVLLLGRFGGGGMEVLQAIAAKLREENYLPIIFDFERPQDRDYTETVKTLVGLARFVIVDLSGPSVPQELYATVPHFKIPFVPIIEAGRKPFSMAVDLLEYPWVVRPPVTFATIEELLEQLPTKVIAPAEEKHLARQKLLDELFNKT